MKYIKQILLFILFIVLVSSCAKPRADAIATIEQENLGEIPDQVAWNIETLFIDSNYTKAKLYASKARIFNKKQITILDGGVKIIFLSKITGERTSQLICDSMVIDDKTKNMYAYKNVVMVSDSSHSTLQTSEIYWNDARQKAITDKFVRIQTPNELIEGIGLESDQDLKNYKILKVSGIKQ